MKILLVTPEFDATKGGVGRYLADLYAGLPADKTFVWADPAMLKPHWLFAVFTVWKKLRECGKGAGVASRESILLHVSHVLPLGTVAFILRLLTGQRYVVSLHGMDFYRGLEVPRKRWLMRLILRSASGITVNSQALGETVQTFVANGTRRATQNLGDTVLVLRPSLPVGYARMAQQALHTKLRAQDGVHLLSVGRLVERKGFDTVIAAMALIPGARLTIVGTGPDQLLLEQLAADSGMLDRITFAGQVDEQNKIALYANADVFVLPTRKIGSDQEGFGIVFLEAQAFGMPVIAGEGIGVTEALHPKLQTFAQRHTAESLAAAVQAVWHEGEGLVPVQALQAFATTFDAALASKRFWKWAKHL